MAYTVPYILSEEEAHLYKAVTSYVKEEFDRAEALANDKRAGTVGFALTILQRRLASSPEAIHQSLRRRRERLEGRLREVPGTAGRWPAGRRPRGLSGRIWTKRTLRTWRTPRRANLKSRKRGFSIRLRPPRPSAN